MATDDADDLVTFRDVRVIRSTAPALLCRIGNRSVWLPRWHVSGKLWCAGDRGKLLIRRWLARERLLIDLHGAPIARPVVAIPPPGLEPHLEQGGARGGAHHAPVRDRRAAAPRVARLTHAAGRIVEQPAGDGARGPCEPALHHCQVRPLDGVRGELSLEHSLRD